MNAQSSCLYVALEEEIKREFVLLNIHRDDLFMKLMRCIPHKKNVSLTTSVLLRHHHDCCRRRRRRRLMMMSCIPIGEYQVQR
mgnify:CR=1 FL=1